MTHEQLVELRNKLLSDKLQQGKDASGYVDGVLDMYNGVKKLQEEVPVKEEHTDGT